MEQMTGHVRAVERAVRVLRTLSQTGQGMGVTQIAKQVQLGKSTVHRLLGTLCQENLVRLDPHTGRYTLGYGLLHLTGEWLARMDVRTVALPHLRALQELCKETVSLNARVGDHRAAIERLVTSHELRHVVDLGRHLPLHVGAGGKVILAFLSEDEVLDLLSRTDLNQRRRQRLLRDLEAIRAQGTAYTLGERIPGAGSISAPIFNHEGRVVGSVSVLSLQSRLPKKVVERLRPQVRLTAAAISTEMGWHDHNRAQLESR